MQEMVWQGERLFGTNEVQESFETVRRAELLFANFSRFWSLVALRPQYEYCEGQ